MSSPNDDGDDDDGDEHVSEDEYAMGDDVLKRLFSLNVVTSGVDRNNRVNR